MKNYIRIILSVFVGLAVASCDKDDDQMVDLDNLAAPTNLGATFLITQDNTGLVTVIPTGTGATLYSIDFGDGSEISEEIQVGERLQHVYEEGEYEVVVTGSNLAGEIAQGTQPLTVSFRQPENLEVIITPDPEDNYTISLEAEADFAAMFNVYFGDAEDEEPTPLMPGESITYTYDAVGTYDVRVVALSGGEATTEVIEQVVISDPIFLPITFESPTLDYTFINFGPDEVGAIEIVENPDPNEVNPSDMVAKYIKVAGSETWAGTTIPLDEPIDFSTERFISVDVWSPAAGVPVIFKVENLADSAIAAEFTATTTVSEGWETLYFDLNAIDPSVEYGRIVLFFNYGIPGTGETYYFDNIQTTKLELIKLPLGFESETLTYTWSGFGGATGGVVDNPDASGINTSAKVVELNEGQGAETWAGMSLDLDEPVDFANGTTAKVKVWSPEAGVPILFKLEDTDSEPNDQGNPSVFVEVISNTTTSEAWEEISFDLSSYDAFDPAVDYDRVILFYDYGNAGEGTTSYYDDIKIGDTDYISLFSEIEDDIAVDTWRTSWSVGDYEEVTFDGVLAKHYSNLDFVGIETIANPIDASDMTHFHVEFYTDNATAFKVKLVDLGPDGVYDGDDLSQHEIVIENPAQNEWVSLDIPLSEFEGLTGTANIGQIIFAATPIGEANVYVREVYFHN